MAAEMEESGKVEDGIWKIKRIQIEGKIRGVLGRDRVGKVPY